MTRFSDDDFRTAAGPPLRIGIFFNARRGQGGLYQYAVTLVHCLYAHEPRHSYTLVHATREPLPFALDSPRWRVITPTPSALTVRLAGEALLLQAARVGWRRPLPLLPTYSELRGTELDLVLYVKPSVHVFLWRYPAIFPIHDLQHLFQPEFPELSANGEWSRREYIYRNAVRRARGILADSEIGREDVIRAYNVPPARVHVLPYLAPTYLATEVSQADLARVQASYQPPDRFLFYPAAFWPHKNHARLLRALQLVATRHGVRIPLLLAGGHSREYPRLVALAQDLGLVNQVRFLGYVPDEDLYPLYRLAFALVMPTFFGPTNIPILEAWASDCPVITTNVRGIPEQVGDAGLVVDPRSETAIADAIWQLWTNPGLRASIIEKGHRKASDWTPPVFTRRLARILTESVRPTTE